ncbi:hypothetical protein VFPPC_04330 [Pochonia chlamydosporia 170]|uniref:Uncharacterized protein n=1 Tax=Pochonia chlamydosporia 170 TaxID=1380566 RepID=A0A179FRN3_METCM|nr:hypothetical protein VFPPC_04330 [Pochonia chlamydosporia 170]OAQ68017.1 hypothetical protein VFPPC_04330 [Pochonia chlamydosporia 170]
MSNDSCAYTPIILNLVGAGSTHDDASSGIIACFIRHYLQQRLIYGQSSDIGTSNQNGHMVPNFNKTLMNYTSMERGKPLFAMQGPRDSWVQREDLV